MTTISKTLSRKLNADKKSQILFRITINRTKQVRFKSGIFVEPIRWSEKRQTIKIPPIINRQAELELEASIEQIKNKQEAITTLVRIYGGELFLSEFIEAKLKVYEAIPIHERVGIKDRELKERLDNPHKFIKVGFFALLKKYLADTSKYSESRARSFHVLCRALWRYQFWVQQTTDPTFELSVQTLDKEQISDFENFLRNEYKLVEQHRKIFESCPKLEGFSSSKQPSPRGNNAICALLNKFRAFLNWCNTNGIAQNRPFLGYNGVTTEKYGTPYYISIEERNTIADFDFSADPLTEVQRDIFIFHCYIGCRVSDLMRLTESNVVDGEIHYIATKTKGKDPQTIKVPLSERASALIEKYQGMDKRGRLFPFISAQRYNDYIKEIFRKCGITRQVTILNPLTGKEEQVPLNEVASSHLARRTFVGNLYKKVKAPNLICPMSGHKVGSAAFARYREIDKELRKETINLLD